MPNEINHAEIAEKLEFLQSFAIANCEPWVPKLLRSATTDERRIVNGELVEVVHGKWREMRNPYDELEGWIHETCGYATREGSNYCPSCGALMDGKDDRYVEE